MACVRRLLAESPAEPGPDVRVGLARLGGGGVGQVREATVAGDTGEGVLIDLELVPAP